MKFLKGRSHKEVPRSFRGLPSEVVESQCISSARALHLHALNKTFFFVKLICLDILLYTEKKNQTPEGKCHLNLYVGMLSNGARHIVKSCKY